MNKVIKWSLILGLVSCLVGVGMITAGAMMGGVSELTSYLGNGDHHIAPDSPVPARSPGGGPSEDESFAGPVRGLEIETGPGGRVEVREEKRTDAQDHSVRVVHGADRDNRYSYQCYLEEETLKIELPDHSGLRLDRVGENMEMEGLVIYVREGERFREVEIDSKAGDFYAERIYSDRLFLDGKAGQIAILGGSAGTVEADCAAGNIQCDAVAENGAEADCKAGKLSLRMAQAKEQYDYEMKCSAGSITLIDAGEEQIAHLHTEQIVDNHTGRMVELDCAAGAIEIRYPGASR